MRAEFAPRRCRMALTSAWEPARFRLPSARSKIGMRVTQSCEGQAAAALEMYTPVQSHLGKLTFRLGGFGYSAALKAGAGLPHAISTSLPSRFEIQPQPC